MQSRDCGDSEAGPTRQWRFPNSGSAAGSGTGANATSNAACVELQNYLGCTTQIVKLDERHLLKVRTAHAKDSCQTDQTRTSKLIHKRELPAKKLIVLYELIDPQRSLKVLNRVRESQSLIGEPDPSPLPSVAPIEK